MPWRCFVAQGEGCGPILYVSLLRCLDAHRSPTVSNHRRWLRNTRIQNGWAQPCKWTVRAVSLHHIFGDQCRIQLESATSSVRLVGQRRNRWVYGGAGVRRRTRATQPSRHAIL